MKPTRTHSILAVSAVISLALVILPVFANASPVLQQADDPHPPGRTVKLIFIHHSTGENLLPDDYGGKGLALNKNNYFVSDTHYGWGPDAIGDRTDILDWTECFTSERTPVFIQALFNEFERLPNTPAACPTLAGGTRSSFGF